MALELLGRAFFNAGDRIAQRGAEQRAIAERLAAEQRYLQNEKERDERELQQQIDAEKRRVDAELARAEREALDDIRRGAIAYKVAPPKSVAAMKAEQLYALVPAIAEAKASFKRDTDFKLNREVNAALSAEKNRVEAELNNLQVALEQHNAEQEIKRAKAAQDVLDKYVLQNLKPGQKVASPELIEQIQMNASFIAEVQNATKMLDPRNDTRAKQLAAQIQNKQRTLASLTDEWVRRDAFFSGEQPAPVSEPDVDLSEDLGAGTGDTATDAPEKTHPPPASPPPPTLSLGERSDLEDAAAAKFYMNNRPLRYTMPPAPVASEIPRAPVLDAAPSAPPAPAVQTSSPTPMQKARLADLERQLAYFQSNPRDPRGKMMVPNLTKQAAAMRAYMGGQATP